MANLSGVSNHFSVAKEGFVTTTSSPVTSGATTVQLTSVAGYTNGDTVVLVIDANDVSKKQVFTGTVDTGGSQITNVVWTEGANTSHILGAPVIDYVTASHQSMTTKGLLVSHDQDGTLKAGAVDNAAVLATDVVETAKIKDGAVTPPKLDSPVQYSRKSYANGSGDYTTSSTTLVSVDATNLITSLTVKSGKLIRVDATIAGITNNNSGYSVGIDIGMDGVSTTSSSGVVTISPSNWANNWDTAGNSRATESHIFYFTNVSPGSHTFRLLWSSSNSGVTARITQYAQQKIIVTELA